jgi:hypothetical protein
LIRGINLLLVVWIASLLASLTWGLVTPQANSQLEHMEAGPASVAADPNAQLIRQLPGWHLMGVATRKQAPVVSNTPVDAPDTRRRGQLSLIRGARKNTMLLATACRVMPS